MHTQTRTCTRTQARTAKAPDGTVPGVGSARRNQHEIVLRDRERLGARRANVAAACATASATDLHYDRREARGSAGQRSSLGVYAGSGSGRQQTGLGVLRFFLFTGAAHSCASAVQPCACLILSGYKKNAIKRATCGDSASDEERGAPPTRSFGKNRSCSCVCLVYQISLPSESCCNTSFCVSGFRHGFILRDLRLFERVRVGVAVLHAVIAHLACSCLWRWYVR